MSTHRLVDLRIRLARATASLASYERLDEELAAMNERPPAFDTLMRSNSENLNAAKIRCAFLVIELDRLCGSGAN